MAATARDISLFDPELGAVFAAFPEFPPFTSDTVPILRQATALTADTVLTACPLLTHEEVVIDGPASKLTLSIFRPKAGSTSPVGQVNRPGIFHIHGGGMLIMDRFAGIEPLYTAIVDCDAVFVSIEYRLAPEHPAPAQLDDCYAGLVWMFDHAAELGVDATRILVTGASAGGNLSASVALLAKDRGGPKLCGQLLMCPMLDDRNTSPSTTQFSTIGTWQKDQNIMAWKWYLGGKEATKYASPAKCTEADVKGLPPTFIDVGAVEIFRDEDIAYAMTLYAAGIPTELHVWPGAFHGFDIVAPKAALSQHAAYVRKTWMKKILAQKPSKL